MEFLLLTLAAWTAFGVAALLPGFLSVQLTRGRFSAHA
jgi:hypothetical protein